MSDIDPVDDAAPVTPEPGFFEPEHAPAPAVSPAPDAAVFQTSDASAEPALHAPDTAIEPATTSPVWARAWREVTSGLQTLVSAAVYATLIVTFVVQVARVDGLSMAPTL